MKGNVLVQRRGNYTAEITELGDVTPSVLNAHSGSFPVLLMASRIGKGCQQAHCQMDYYAMHLRLMSLYFLLRGSWIWD